MYIKKSSVDVASRANKRIRSPGEVNIEVSKNPKEDEKNQILKNWF